jgi:hypothetical protein
MTGVNEELVWIVDREFHTTTAGPTTDAPLTVFGKAESSIDHARAHARALLGKSTAFDVEWEQRAFSCHVRPLYGEQESIVGSFGVAIETTESTRERTPPRVARRMRAFSRPGRPAPVDVAAHLNALLPRIRQVVPDSVSLVCELPQERLVAAFDAERLAQIVIGLVGNARDAMPQGGTLRIDVERQPEAIEIVISDDGIGMSHEHVGRAFEPYFTTKRGHAGLGARPAGGRRRLDRARERARRGNCGCDRASRSGRSYDLGRADAYGDGWPALPRAQRLATHPSSFRTLTQSRTSGRRTLRGRR